MTREAQEFPTIRPAGWRERMLDLGLCAGCVVVFARLVRSVATLPSDDAWISFRYAWNLVHGHGLTWNPTGPTVEGYSNLLWTLCMVPALAVGGSIMAWAHALGFGFSAATVALGYALVRQAGGGRGAATGAGLGIACHPISLLWTWSGLEPPLLAFLVTMGTLLAARRADRGQPASLGLWLLPWALLPTAHVEGPFLALLPLAWIGAEARQLGPRRALAAGGALALPALCQLAFRLVYYHDVVPNTWYAKVSGQLASGGLWRGLRYALGYFTYDRWLGLFLIVGLGAAWVARRGLWLLPLLGALAFSVAVSGDQIQGLRFFVGPTPVTLAAAALGLEGLVRRLQAPLRRWGSGALALAGVALVHRQLGVSMIQSSRSSQPPGDHLPGVAAFLAEDHASTVAQGSRWARLWAASPPAPPPHPLDWFAAWLLETVPDRGTAALGDVGLLGYALNGVNILDYRGLNWRAMAKMLGDRPPEGPPGLIYPTAKAVLDEAEAAAPELMLLQCSESGLHGPLEALGAGSGWLMDHYDLVAHGRYTTQQTYICVYRRRGVGELDQATIIARYTRLSKEIGDVYDVSQRLAAWRRAPQRPVTGLAQRSLNWNPEWYRGGVSWEVFGGQSGR